MGGGCCRVDTGDGEVEGGGDQAGEGEEVVDTWVEGDVAPCITAAPGESPFAGEEGVEEEAPSIPSACPSARGGGITGSTGPSAGHRETLKVRCPASRWCGSVASSAAPCSCVSTSEVGCCDEGGDMAGCCIADRCIGPNASRPVVSCSDAGVTAADCCMANRPGGGDALLSCLLVSVFVTSQKFQNKTNEFPLFQILEPIKTFIQLSLIHSYLA